MGIAGMNVTWRLGLSRRSALRVDARSGFEAGPFPAQRAGGPLGVAGFSLKAPLRKSRTKVEFTLAGLVCKAWLQV